MATTIGRTDARAQRGSGGLIAAATLAGVYLLVFGPGVLTSLRVVAGYAAPPSSPAWTDRVADVEWDVFSVAVVVLVIARWLPRRAAEVTTRMYLARPRIRRLATAVALYVGVAAVASWLSGSVVAAAHLPTAQYTRLGGGLAGYLFAGTAATAASVTEELTMVALATAVVGYLCRGTTRRWTVPATLMLLIALRLLVHLYYLWGSLFVLLWVPGAYLVYRWARSIWPLVIGHCVYDWLALTGAAFPRTARVVDAVLWVAAGCAVATLATTSRRAARSSSCSVRW